MPTTNITVNIPARTTYAKKDTLVNQPQLNKKDTSRAESIQSAGIPESPRALSIENVKRVSEQNATPRSDFGSSQSTLSLNQTAPTKSLPAQSQRLVERVQNLRKAYEASSTEVSKRLESGSGQALVRSARGETSANSTVQSKTNGESSTQTEAAATTANTRTSKLASQAIGSYGRLERLFREPAASEQTQTTPTTQTLQQAGVAAPAAANQAPQQALSLFR